MDSAPIGFICTVMRTLMYSVVSSIRCLLAGLLLCAVCAAQGKIPEEESFYAFLRLHSALSVELDRIQRSNPGSEQFLLNDLKSKLNCSQACLQTITASANACFKLLDSLAVERDAYTAPFMSANTLPPVEKMVLFETRRKGILLDAKSKLREQMPPDIWLPISRYIDVDITKQIRAVQQSMKPR